VQGGDAERPRNSRRFFEAAGGKRPARQTKPQCLALLLPAEISSREASNPPPCGGRWTGRDTAPLSTRPPVTNVAALDLSQIPARRRRKIRRERDYSSSQAVSSRQRPAGSICTFFSSSRFA